MNPNPVSMAITPEFHESLTWLNVPPIRLGALRGHPLLLLFWNGASAHGVNALQVVQTLMNRFRGEVGFLTIHVPKFDFERDGLIAWEAMHLSGVNLPLASDVDWAAWQHFGLTALPTAVLVDAGGTLKERATGDRAIEGLLPAIEAVVDVNFRHSPGHIELPRPKAPEVKGALDTPSGLTVTANRLYVADTGHHRILECTHDGRVLRRIGHGNRDSVDGLADAAGFHSPRDLVVLQDRLYVADAGNHAIRRINMRTGEVETLLGNGRNGDPIAGTIRLPGDSPLDRPWGLALSQSNLLITQASAHQLWAFDLGTRVLSRLSGSGQFGGEDGDADSASFAQPAGVAVLGDQAFVLDAASSALRQVKLADGSVRTLFGRGLFEFGLKDGGNRQALMQYPTALAPTAGSAGLWIADTGNGALRKWTARNQAISTIALPAVLHRPAALAALQNHVWIADAGNAVVWRLDTDSGEMLRLPVGE